MYRMQKPQMKSRLVHYVCLLGIGFQARRYSSGRISKSRAKSQPQRRPLIGKTRPAWPRPERRCPDLPVLDGSRRFRSLTLMTVVLCYVFVSPSAFSREDVSTLKGFERAFRHANASGDIRRLEHLVVWDHQKETAKSASALRQRLHEGLGHQIQKIQILPFSTEISLFGQVFGHPSVQPTHIFVVWYILPRDSTGVPIVGTRYPIGRKNGQFYIVPTELAPVSSIHY